MPRNLVAAVAERLMEATASTAAQVSEQVLAQLVEQLKADASFLRRNDHGLRASVLVAEWPPRPHVPDPDPLAVIHFTSADPVFAVGEHGKKPVLIAPKQMERAYRRWIAESRHSASPSVAVAPLSSGEQTTGTIGVVKFGRKKWKPEAINTLEAVASLFAQFQARIAAEERLQYLVEHDDLTALHNRRALMAYLSERLAAGRPAPVSVLYLDLDRLKSINDCFGHAAGDWLIQVVAERLRMSAGKSMTARIGGDEFIVVPDRAMSINTAEAFAQQLKTKLCCGLTIGDDAITPAVSIGVAAGTPGRGNTADLLNRADEAVLAAKRAGGDQVAVSTGYVSLKNALRNELHLRGEIDSEALLLHYLPEVDLWSGAIVAVEALVRWQHPERGLLLPDAFIGVVESTNLATELGRWVMRSACADLSRWRSHGVGQNAMLRINVSPTQLVSCGFVRSVADIIEEFGIDGSSVCLEITERAVVGEIEITRRALEELKEIGVQIAIDDFGTGYAVLSHLKSLPVDALKIDASFVRDLGTSPGDLAIVRSIIGLGEAFDLQVVAEGVETPAAALTLMRHGCRRAQGYLLSRPLPNDATESLLSEAWIPMPF
ncbi:putative bifunctional diguanylate cyclase/phosphodiesterase, partial [Mycobacterium sp.]|uniref:putative bifunctional diguanylate cyclase/phosphodiesterase n=1 Tax=Mycobacterium sp. TaxID=1785 RepID=UPI003C778E14